MQCWLFAAHDNKKRSRAAPYGKWLPWVFRFFLTGCRMSQIHPAGCRMSRPPRNLKKKRKSGEWAVAVLFGGLRWIYPVVDTGAHFTTSVCVCVCFLVSRVARENHEPRPKEKNNEMIDIIKYVPNDKLTSVIR